MLSFLFDLLFGSSASAPQSPLDGVPWFDEHWMFVGPLLGAAVMLRALISPSIRSRRLLLLAWSNMPLYTIHQFEEHGFDVFGKRYPFIHYFNDHNPFDAYVTPRMITIINITVAWLVFLLAAWRAERTGDIVPAAFCWGIALANGVMAHILPAFLKQQYNPGVVQSVTLLVPFGLLFLRTLLRQYTQRGKMLVVASLLFGGPVAHGALLMLPIKLCNAGILDLTGFSLWMTLGPLIAMAVASRLLGKYKASEHEY